MTRLNSRLKSYLVGFLLIASNNIFSQWDFSLSADQSYNNNPFRLPEKQDSWISSLDLGIHRQFGDFHANYYGSYNYFEAIPDRNFYWHQLGVGFAGQTTGAGVHAELRTNRADYSIYDYVMLNGYFNQQFQLATLNWLWSNSAIYNDYSELTQLNNWELSSAIRIHRTFPTRTTTMGGAGIHYKKYTNSEQTVPVDATAEMYMSILGDGKGGGGRHGTVGGGGGYFSQTVYADFEVPSITQIRLWGRVAQSITPTTGLAVQYNYQHLLSESTRFITGITYNYSEESQIFDDPMGYDAYSIGAELAQLLFGGMMLKGAFYYKDKQYVSQGIYIDSENYDNSILRTDISKTAWVYVQKLIGVGFGGGSELILKLNYQWIDNQSNSYWYDYSAHHVGVGFEFQF